MRSSEYDERVVGAAHILDHLATANIVESAPLRTIAFSDTPPVLEARFGDDGIVTL